MGVIKLHEIIVRVFIQHKLKSEMGGKQSTPADHENGEAPKVNHPRFQNIKFTRNKENEDCIEVKTSVPNIKQYNTWVSSLKDAPTQSENFLLPQSHQFQKEGLCGSSGYVNILFQNFPYVLADEIRNRASLKQKFFEQPELWYLIYTLISAGHEFHKSGKKIGDVRPENVFINEDGQVKVATCLTWPGQSTNYHKSMFQKQVTYLSPQEIKDIQFSKMEPTCDPKVAESFSIGLTCLDAGTLGSSLPLYLKNNKFDYNGLSSRLQQLHNTGYSEILSMVVSNLCEPDSDKRSTCSELYKWLEPHEQNIINLEPFSVNSLPEKFGQLGLSHEYDQSLNQSVLPQNGNNQSPGPNSYTIPNQIQTNYISSSQAAQSSTNPVTQFGGQTVTYYQVPNPVVSNLPPQQFVRGYTQVVETGSQVAQQGQVNPPVLSQPPVQVAQQPQVVQSNQQAGQYTENRTTTSTYTYSQFPASGQYVAQVPGQYVQTVQNVQYIRPPVGSFQQVEGGDRPKSNMELTLEKIDEQLQMSRKMFPS